MSEEMIGIIITSMISLISLIISLKNYLISKPELKIVISDKQCDAYFGDVCAKNESIVDTKIGAVEINIINNSPVDIFIKLARIIIDWFVKIIHIGKIYISFIMTLMVNKCGMVVE